MLIIIGLVFLGVFLIVVLVAAARGSDDCAGALSR